MFQVCELRKHQLIEAHVRCYAIRHERDERFGTVSCFQAYNMRLTHPDDDLGSMLLLVFPSVVVHAIDFHSPFMPPPLWLSATGAVSWQPRRAKKEPEDDDDDDDDDEEDENPRRNNNDQFDVYHFPGTPNFCRCLSVHSGMVLTHSWHVLLEQLLLKRTIGRAHV